MRSRAQGFGRGKWGQAGASELARLAQGLNGAEGMGAAKLTAKAEVPRGKKLTYAKHATGCRPEKDEPWRLRATCGGGRLQHLGEAAAPAASMEAIKCQLSSIASSPGAKAAAGGTSSMCLSSFIPEGEEEHARLHLGLTPGELIGA